MKAKVYHLLEKCIEDGIQIGFARAHKHNDNPSQDALFEEQRKAILNEISEWFEFSDDDLGVH